MEKPPSPHKMLGLCQIVTEHAAASLNRRIKLEFSVNIISLLYPSLAGLSTRKYRIFDLPKTADFRWWDGICGFLNLLGKDVRIMLRFATDDAGGI